MKAVRWFFLGFVMIWPHSGFCEYHLETVPQDEYEAFKKGLQNPSPRQASILDTLGALRGHVKFGWTTETLGYKSLEGIDVFIPGTSYTAKTDATGYYLLTGIPAGSYNLVARSNRLPASATSFGTIVRPQQTFEVPDLALTRDSAASLSRISPNYLAVWKSGRMTELKISGQSFGDATEVVSVAIGPVSLYSGQDFSSENGNTIRIRPSWGLSKRLATLKPSGWQQLRIIVNQVPSKPDWLYVMQLD